MFQTTPNGFPFALRLLILICSVPTSSSFFSCTGLLISSLEGCYRNLCNEWSQYRHESHSCCVTANSKNAKVCLTAEQLYPEDFVYKQLVKVVAGDHVCRLKKMRET